MSLALVLRVAGQKERLATASDDAPILRSGVALQKADVTEQRIISEISD